MGIPSTTALMPLMDASIAGAIQNARPIALPTSSASSPDFSDMVSQGLQSVNSDLVVAQVELQKLATGEAASLHQVMIRLEESRLSFQLMLQVRNRLLEAYQDVMKMQV